MAAEHIGWFGGSRIGVGEVADRNSDELLGLCASLSTRKVKQESFRGLPPPDLSGQILVNPGDDKFRHERLLTAATSTPAPVRKGWTVYLLILRGATSR